MPVLPLRVEGQRMVCTGEGRRDERHRALVIELHLRSQALGGRRTVLVIVAIRARVGRADDLLPRAVEQAQARLCAAVELLALVFVVAVDDEALGRRRGEGVVLPVELRLDVDRKST